MTSLCLRRKTLLLLLAAALAGPWGAMAATTRPARAPRTAIPAVSNLFARSWSFLRNLWGEEGCDIDPNGRCVTRATPTSDTGCDVDPDGHCLIRPRTTAHEGCGIDPDGRCATRAARPKPTAETGCDIDPSGRCHT